MSWEITGWGITDFNGYVPKTTFWDDFTIADNFGAAAVEDTYKRAMESWKNDYIYLTELVMVLNHKIWQHYEAGNRELSKKYDECWRLADRYAVENLTGDELKYFFDVTD